MYMESSVGAGGASVRDLSTAWEQVAAMVAAVEATLGKWLMDNYNIGLTEYRAALHLSRTPKRELRITELAYLLGLNQSSVTRLVGRMEGKGLVYRDTCPDDGRGVYAVITEKGMDAVREIRDPYEQKLGEQLRSGVVASPQLDAVGLDRSFELVRTLIS